MTSILTQTDVARLLAEPSSLVRSEVASKLALEIDSPRLTATELKLAQDIVGILAKDVETSVRRSLALSLRMAQRLPKDVALRLALDVESVALPILSSSPLLSDQDLVEIIERGSAAKQEAIAGRTLISERVSDVLITNASERAVATLMSNVSARISDTSFHKAVDRFKDSIEVKENLVKRKTLPLTVTERLVAIVSDQLKDYLVAHHELTPNLAADLVLESRERSILNVSAQSKGAEVEKLVSQMHANGRLTPSVVLRALCMGDIAFFEIAIATMASVPLINARILIHDGGRLGLKSLYSKSCLPAQLLPAVRIAIEVVRDTPFDGGARDRERFRSRVIERILTQGSVFASEDLDYLIARLSDISQRAAQA